MQELTLCYHKNSKRTVLFWKGHLLSLHMAKTGYKFFFQSKVTVNLVWHGFRHIFADFLLMSAKFRTDKIFFRTENESLHDECSELSFDLD